MQPGWVARMPAGQWFRISGERPDLGLQPTPPGTRYLGDNDPANDPALNPARSAKERLRRWLGRRPHSPWEGRSGFPAITEAWNGAVLASRFGEAGSMVVFGGGHNDYFGADMHAFDLNTRQWSRIADGFISGDVRAYGAGAVYPDAEYPDGSPLPPHTYSYVQYDPAGNDYLLFKGQLELGPDVKAVAVPHMFSFDARAWRRGPRHPAAILNSGGCTAWDAKRGVMWGHSGDAGGGNAFLCFDPHGDNGDGTFGRWGEMFSSKLPDEADHNAMAMDPVRDIIVVTVHARNALGAIDPAHPDRPLVALRTSADQPRIREYAALEFAPNLRAFAYFSAASGAAVHTLTPPPGAGWAGLTESTWNWQAVLDGKNALDPVAEASRESAYGTSITHTFGRFRIASYAETDVAILVRHIDSPVYAMRLS